MENLFGVIDKKKPERIVPAQTIYMEEFNTDSLPDNVFHIITIGGGTIVVDINGYACHVIAKSVICLNERKQIRVLSGRATNIKVISFLPQFLNVNMTPDLIRNQNYQNLCDIHSFFQLSPFLTDDPDKMVFSLSDDTFSRFNQAIDQVEKNLTLQPDWYWSCRARSNFIDIINTLERLYHDYYLPEPSDDSLYPVRIQEDFREIIIFINNHLNEKITLDRLYKQFHINKNKLQQIFKKYLNQTLQEYLNRRRFEEATYYLKFTELRGDEIAERLSFSGAQAFSRFFTNICGQTPESYRREKVEKRKISMRELHQIEEKSRYFRDELLLMDRESSN